MAKATEEEVAALTTSLENAYASFSALPLGTSTEDLRKSWGLVQWLESMLSWNRS